MILVKLQIFLYITNLFLSPSQTLYPVKKKKKKKKNTLYVNMNTGLFEIQGHLAEQKCQTAVLVLQEQVRLWEEQRLHWVSVTTSKWRESDYSFGK